MNIPSKQINTMPANLSGRLRNTPLPVTSGMLPLFEAVVNSIHSIEEADVSMNNGRITILIQRKSKQGNLDLNDHDTKKKGPGALEDIIGFTIEDNGIGFTDENMASFRTLDSEHKIKKGCRGIGRLLWLKAFKEVRVESIFQSNNKLYLRCFKFSSSEGISDESVKELSTNAEVKTSIHLDDFIPRYRDYSRKTPKAISDSIFEHCLWYFIRTGSAPLIELHDDGEVTSLNDVFEEHMHSSAKSEIIKIKEQEFSLIHIRLRSNSLSTHTIAYCADNRLVTEEKLIGKLPGLHGLLSDENGAFIYSCYVSSPFLDESVRPERTGFEIVEDVEELLKKTEIGLNDIRAAIVKCAKEQLADYLKKNIKRSRERVSKFVSSKAPRYRPILARIPEEELNVDPEISDKDLELTLHKQFANIERELLSEGHDILTQTQTAPDDTYNEKLASYLEKAADIKKSDLGGAKK